jgi:ABC-2 type transport system ATP-binding protein
MIELIDVHKKYRLRRVLKGVSFTAEKGQITCLIGENGAGKSTILKSIMRLTPIHGGMILIDGQRDPKDLYEKAAFIPDHLIAPGGMRLSEAMDFMKEFYQGWDEERSKELMSFFRLEPRERVGNLSKGMAAKFNLVLGFSLRTEYVLMDEPFSGIDLFSREQIAQVFTSELMEDRGVLLTTHEVAEIEHLIDKAVLLQDGKVVQEIDSERLRSEEGKSIVDVMREVYLG